MISLIDIRSSLDDKNEPVGHGLKILKDFPSIFDNNVEILAGKKYIQKLKYRSTALPLSIRLDFDKHESIKVLCNYFVSLFLAKGDVLIYTFTREPLLWGIALLKKRKKIVAITYTYWDRYMEDNHIKNPVRRFLIKRGLKRLDGCIVTNYLYHPEVPSVRVPDYYITDELKKYMTEKKKYGCVCLGEIRAGKDVIGLVRVMRRTNIPVLIAGSFRDRKIYQRITKLQTGNIRIEDQNLPYETYMEYLSTYKYIVLPYDARCYDGATSGVLLEGIFLGAVPIAPISLLKQNKIQGLGYHSISEIPELIQLYEGGKVIINNNLEKYSFERYKSKVSDFIKKISEM